MSITGISRPYGQNGIDINTVKHVCDRKSGDVTSPATPQLRRAWAFEMTADGSALAPPPPPRGQPGRDPLVIELGNIEVGTRIELISLSDNPKAEFDATCAKEIFELPLTGYDVNGRIATIALNEDQMKEKGIGAGERFMLRQVDKDGNASEAIHVHLDPQGWATAQIREPTSDGGVQNVRGRAIDIAVGIHNLPGNANPGKLERVLGKMTTDVTAPKLVTDNVTAGFVGVKLSPKELERAKEIVAAYDNFIGNAEDSVAAIKTWVETPKNKANFENDPSNSKAFKVLVDAVSSGGQKQWDLMLAGAPGTRAGNVSFAQMRTPGWTGQEISVRFEKALEPGAIVNVQNSRTGESKSATLSAAQRGTAFSLRDMVEGDPVVITYTDAAGNAGTPYGFRFDPQSKDGKACKQNPLDIRLGGFNFKPATTGV